MLCPADTNEKILKAELSGFFGGATRNRTGDKGVADLCLTAWLWRHFIFRLNNGNENLLFSFPFLGADYGSRTRHLDLGKVALYQMS